MRYEVVDKAKAYYIVQSNIRHKKANSGHTILFNLYSWKIKMT